MYQVSDFIDRRISERRENQLLRTLAPESGLIDFSSNDYLGFARSPELKKLISDTLSTYSSQPLGSTGSRLITGNTHFIEDLENEIAAFHQAEAGLIYNSGYDANIGLFSCLPQRGDTVITDELIHASIIDGVRLTHANRYTFKHNDLQSLEEKLKAARGKIFIGVESVYSMDGDEAPLTGIVGLAEKYGAVVIVDEAHATGIFGLNGRGLINHHNLQERVFARIVTFGKALGAHGAIVLSSQSLRSYQINFSRPFIYSTAPSFYSNLSVKMAYQHLQQVGHSRRVSEVIVNFKELTDDLKEHFLPSNSPIQSLIVEGNEKAKALAGELQREGYNVKAILSPTVPAGKERLRICLHTFNTVEQLTGLTEILKKKS